MCVQHPCDPIYTPGLASCLCRLVHTWEAWGKATSQTPNLLLALGTDLPTLPLHSHPALRLPTALLLLCSQSPFFPASFPSLLRRHPTPASTTQPVPPHLPLPQLVLLNSNDSHVLGGQQNSRSCHTFRYLLWAGPVSSMYLACQFLHPSKLPGWCHSHGGHPVRQTCLFSQLQHFNKRGCSSPQVFLDFHTRWLRKACPSSEGPLSPSSSGTGLGTGATLPQGLPAPGCSRLACRGFWIPPLHLPCAPAVQPLL